MQLTKEELLKRVGNSFEEIKAEIVRGLPSEMKDETGQIGPNTEAVVDLAAKQLMDEIEEVAQQVEAEKLARIPYYYLGGCV